MVFRTISVSAVLSTIGTGTGGLGRRKFMIGLSYPLTVLP